MSLLITISGPPGSGTTTAATQVGSALGLDLVFGGEVFRAMASEAGMSLGSFGVYAAEHPEVDVELDRRLARRAAEGGVVIESRLAGWIAANEGLESVAVALFCDDTVRADRVAQREGIAIEQALADNADREKVEQERYLALYDIDIADMAPYDLVIDTGAHEPAAVTEQVVALARRRWGR